ncbi:MAG: hypothetical protein LBL09_02415 [Oscillospiraceae bacterium]|nr:hypothetical protein [Oscillospiraceae bacterium]
MPRKKISETPKIPARASEFEEMGLSAPKKLRDIADDPDTPVKLKADIERWFSEMVFGKPQSGSVKSESGEKKPVVVIKFEGELEKWSK